MVWITYGKVKKFIKKKIVKIEMGREGIKIVF